MPKGEDSLSLPGSQLAMLVDLRPRVTSLAGCQECIIQRASVHCGSAARAIAPYLVLQSAQHPDECCEP